ncbi:substrate-binding domain-containing protein [Nisaea denitrificans]|uniref:substrate-binding domain-containing protein n=1 Tax=Nisaea denitrificans TaxID=390877 RepID=UPI000409B653|nr:substrate-binding domain-containing protein [Nisaea denitrificans]
MKHLKRILGGLALAAMLALTGTGNAESADKFITLQSTTSTQNSGLFDYMLPIFSKKTGIEVRVVAVGTGQALKNARNGDGDVLFVHAKPAEEKFVADGFGVSRQDVMFNDFVIVGPAADPAKVGGMKDAPAALKMIADAKTPFASRGDDSGTHKKEKRLWKAAGVDADASSGSWYRETGSGMGATLNAAVGMGAYALTDRATWISFKNKSDFKVQVEGDKVLFNQYGVILVNPAKHPVVKKELGQTFIDWVTGDEGQETINSYKLNGQQLFFANAK